jgi:uncharacterized membrane protein
MLALTLVLLFISGLSWLAAIWVKRIARRRQDAADARLDAAMGHFPRSR